MKKSILILGILLPLFSLSQSINKVITKENKIYIGDIYKSYGNNIIFLNGVNPSLTSNRLEIALVKEIYGPIAKSTKKIIIKKNNNIIFYPEYDVYLILNGFKDSQFTFSLRISNKINLTTHEIHDRIMKEVKIISGGHEKTSGIAVSESDIEQFMEVFIHIMKELL